MRKSFSIYVLAALLMLLYGCGSKPESNLFRVEGHLSGFGNDPVTVYLYNAALGDTPLDSTSVSEDTFAFTYAVDTPAVAYVVAVTPAGPARSFLVMEHGEVYLDMNNDSVAGTPLNESLCAFLRDFNEESYVASLRACLADYYSASSIAERKRVEAEYDSVETLRLSALSASAMRCFEANRNNVVGAFALARWASECRPQWSEVEPLMAKAGKQVQSYAPLQQIVNGLRAAQNTAEGMHYVDVEGIDFATGETTQLSNMIEGRLALVDFWASWCAPCRSEISENLIRIYEKYKGAGLQVVGIDVWDKPEAHRNAVSQLGITYMQLIDTTRNATDLYGINGIPEIILIAPDGTIKARGLRGNAIEQAVIDALQ